MKFHIPKLKEELVLTKDWIAKVHGEYRNHEFLKQNGVCGDATWKRHEITNVFIPAGTKLIVDRIYIRQNAQFFDSITFLIKKQKGSELFGRFWVKLDNANEIEFEEPCQKTNQK